MYYIVRYTNNSSLRKILADSAAAARAEAERLDKRSHLTADNTILSVELDTSETSFGFLVEDE